MIFSSHLPHVSTSVGRGARALYRGGWGPVWGGVLYSVTDKNYLPATSLPGGNKRIITKNGGLNLVDLTRKETAFLDQKTLNE